MTSSFQVRIRILSWEGLYLFWVWMNSDKSRKRQICKQAILKLFLAYSFRKIVFHWSKFKALSDHIFLSFNLLSNLLLSNCIDTCWLGLVSHCIKEILYLNTCSKENQSWNKNKEIYIFTCLWYSCWKILGFFNVEWKFLIRHFQFFSVSWTLRRVVNLNRFLKKCLNYYVLRIFSSQHCLETSFDG